MNSLGGRRADAPIFVLNVDCECMLLSWTSFYVEMNPDWGGS